MEISYARKYRPRTLDEYLGTDNKERVLQRLKDPNNYPQTILLYGTRGTGKTTLARLIAKEMLCTSKVDGHACGKCLNCMTIDDELIDNEFGQTTFGVTEIDVGTDGGKDNILNLAESILQPPAYGCAFNIFILDECHMLTKQAQNALLKMLEEIPSTSVIILATTDPDRLLDTVRDRCQLRLQTKPAQPEELLERLLEIANKEKLTVSKEALKLIINESGRNPRNSITILENVAKNFDKQVTLENTLIECDKVGNDLYIEYINGAQSIDPISSTLSFCEKLETMGITYKDFLDGLIGFVTNCIKIKYGIGIENETKSSLKAAKKLFGDYNISDLDCVLQIMEYAAKMMNSSQNVDKLVVMTTAMRISKTKILQAGLQYVEQETVRETEKGAEIAVQNLKLDQKDSKVLEVTEQSLSAAFGKQIKEIESGDSLRLGATDDDDVSDTESEELAAEDSVTGVMTDEQLLDYFKIK